MSTNSNVKTKLRLDPSDFQTYEYSIISRNNTTQTEICDAKKIRVVEFTEKGMTLQMPIGCCSEGHLLQLEVFPGRHGLKVVQFPKAGELKGALSITCKVHGIEAAKKAGFALFNMELLQYNEKEWARFKSKFASLQKEIDRIFKVVKE